MIYIKTGMHILDKAFEEHSRKNASNTTLDEEKETTYN